MQGRLRESHCTRLLPVARALEAAETGGDEGASAWRDRMGRLWRVFRAAVARVEGDDRPADGWTVEAAADWVWARGHLEGWQHLVVERGWSPEDHEERVVRSVLAEVLASAG
jgi:hypothetical protein